MSIIHAENSFTPKAKALHTALKISTQPVPKFTDVYAKNYECLYFSLKGTLREQRHLQLKTNRTAQEDADLIEVSAALDELMGDVTCN